MGFFQHVEMGLQILLNIVDGLYLALNMTDPLKRVIVNCKEYYLPLNVPPAIIGGFSGLNAILIRQL